MNNDRIMIVDDEQEIAQLIKDYLEAERYDVIISSDGKECLELFREYKPSLIILDIMLTGLDGMEVCRILRAESSVPIIMLSAKKLEVDKILALGLGADDYIVKPFSPREVVARVKAQLRRYNQLFMPNKDSNALSFSGLIIDLKGYTVKLNGILLDFTAKEFEVLRCLALHSDQVLTRQQIYDYVWGINEYGDLNTVTIHINKIRGKIEPDISLPRYIKTVRGVGYKFEGKI